MRTELIVLMRPEVTLTKLDLFRLRQKNEERWVSMHSEKWQKGVEFSGLKID